MNKQNKFVYDMNENQEASDLPQSACNVLLTQYTCNNHTHTLNDEQK